VWRGRAKEEGLREQKDSGDGTGHFAENVLKAAVAPGLVFISQTLFLVCF